jgi:hypothetical protein
MIERIKEYLKSEDEEIKQLGVKLAIEYLNPEDLNTIDFLNASEYFNIAVSIDYRIFLEERGGKK